MHVMLHSIFLTIALPLNVYGSYYNEGNGYEYHAPNNTMQSIESTQDIVEKGESLMRSFTIYNASHDQAIQFFPWQRYIDAIIEQQNQKRALEFTDFLQKLFNVGIEINIDMQSLLTFIMHPLIYKIEIYLTNQDSLTEHNRKILEKEIDKKRKQCLNLY